MNRKLYKAAHKRVLDKKNFYRHLIVFVVGNFVLFFISLQSWTPAVYYLLTLIWIRVLAIHFATAYPNIVKDFGFKSEKEEEKAIEREMKRLKKEQKLAKKRVAQQTENNPHLKLHPATPKAATPRNYEDADLV